MPSPTPACDWATRPRLATCYREEIGLRDQFSPALADQVEVRRERAGLRDKLGDLSVSLGDPQAGREHFQQALELRQEIAAQNPDETQAHRDVLLSLQKLGNHELIYSRDPKIARQYYQQALDGFLERLKAEPASVLAKMDVALAHYYVATADLRAGDRDSAMAHYRECRDIREELAKDPKTKLSSLDLMLALARTGDHDRASEIAEAMIKEPPLDARIYFHSACGFALSAGAAASLPASAESTRLVRHYTDRALDALRLALKHGWRSAEEVATDPDLDPILRRSRLRGLARRVPQGGAVRAARPTLTPGSGHPPCASSSPSPIISTQRATPRAPSVTARSCAKPNHESRGALGLYFGTEADVRYSASRDRHCRQARRPGEPEVRGLEARHRRLHDPGPHLLPRLRSPAQSFLHQPTDAEPFLLGFECHAALYERIGDYDYYCYLEDDLVVTDPWLFAKLSWFRDQVGPESVLLPNRFEVARGGVAWKAYLDGDLAPEVTAQFPDRSEWPELRASFLGVDARFVRPLNPHSGCFMLGLEQMRQWALRPDFLDRDCGFVGPLESAASLGVMRAFRVYKPAPEVASFLEIAHFGTAFIDNLRLDPPP